MKYRLLLASLFLMLSESHAQFLLQPGGFVADGGKGFYVVEVPGASQQQLFEALERRVQTSFGAFRSRVSADEGRELLFQATDRGGLTYYGRDYDVTFLASFEFKKGKIKVNAPVIKSIRSFNPLVDSVASLLTVKSQEPLIFREWRSFVYDKKDKLKNRQLKETLEAFMNKRILEPLLAVSAAEAW
ncbi:hypothetical protein [Niabella drilacis]|uniref:DUF4468 domain-containing protein n=1 Tax=Niabella drilacis (strain DSM 25811 / CCM 8410 / CCUG 62505 / LMG 26954 / E90) TaxID=1285928 RepID=A0A1G6PI04_NIADE|nr:hypothetical protein [Niabella drilacis]SDC78995.1 hypothetical protein SAMN04487894_10423 [Niabella drilacis]